MGLLKISDGQVIEIVMLSDRNETRVTRSLVYIYSPFVLQFLLSWIVGGAETMLRSAVEDILCC